MNNKYLRLSAIAALLLGLFVYLAWLNFHLPFMTTDELRYILASPKGVADHALSAGRYSSLIMIPFAEILSFINPTNINLIPRFASMLILAAGIILLIRKLGFTNFSAVLLTALILIGHEIDWQHNGLVSFFGIYNVLLPMFFLALILDEGAKKSTWVFALVFVLLVGTYASELFIGLSLCYIVLKVAISREAKFLVRSPFVWSLVFYALAYLTIKATINVVPLIAEWTSIYLIGSVGAYRVDQMLTAALLYFINALPYYHLLGVSVSVSVAISSLVLISVSGYFIKLLLEIKNDGKTNTAIVAAEREWLLVVMLFLLSVTPNLLLALQPMKVDWILRNASVRYAFSFYTWIGLAVVCAYFGKQTFARSANAITGKVFSSIAALVLLGAVLVSAMQNIHFVNEYKDSRGKWVQLNEILKQSISKEVVVSPTYLQHPHISSVTPEQLKTFAKKYYDVQLGICSIDSEIKLNEEASKKIVQLEGFSVPESDGAWTEGAIATIRLVEENPKANFVELDVTSVFYENKNTPVIVTKGGKKYKFKIDGIGKYRFDLPDRIEGQIQIQFFIAKPISPFKLGQSLDTRDLGIKLKNIRLGFKDPNNQESLHVIKVCYQ